MGRQAIQQQLESLNTLPEGKERLNALVANTLEKASNEEYGDALGSLCQELAKQPGKPAEASAELMQEVINWASKQLAALGKSVEQATEFASYFVATLQGIHLLSSTFKNISLTEKQCQTLNNWVAAV